MLATGIIEAIERRRAQYRDRCRAGASSEADRINLRITEEYDSLMNEIHALCAAKGRVRPPAPIFQEDPSEEWILGDQGQWGG